MRRLGSLVLSTVLLVLTGWLLVVPPAQAAPFECKTPPVPEVPGRGSVSDTFLPPPDPLPPQGDPFAPGSTTSIYEQYGMAGFTFNTYDLGCTPDPQWAAAPVMSSLANVGMSIAKFGIGLTGGLTAVAMQPGWLGGLDHLVASATHALWTAVTQPFALVMLPLLGVMLLWRASRWRWGQVIAAATFAVLALVIAAGVATYPTESASVADKTLSATVSSVNTTVLGTQGDPATAATAASVDAVLWPRWVSGVLGDPTSVTARKYAPDLFRASALTWREAAESAADPDRAQQIVEQKNDLWTRTAEKVQAEDPDAYEYLIGHRGDARVWDGVLATISMLCSQPFLAVSALLVIGSYLALRLLVMFFPAIAVFGLLPQTQHILKSAGSVAVAALINTVVFGIGAAVTMLGIRYLLDPSNGLPTWLGLLLMALWSFVMWKVLTPFRRLTSLVHQPDPVRRAAEAVPGTARAVGSYAKGAASTAIGSFVGTKAADGDTPEQGQPAAPGGRVEEYSRDAAPAAPVAVAHAAVAQAAAPPLEPSVVHLPAAATKTSPPAASGAGVAASPPVVVVMAAPVPAADAGSKPADAPVVAAPPASADAPAPAAEPAESAAGPPIPASPLALPAYRDSDGTEDLYDPAAEPAAEASPSVIEAQSADEEGPGFLVYDPASARSFNEER